MKKHMKAFLITGLCGVMMMSGFVFADTDTSTKADGPRGERPQHEQMTEEEREAQQAEREAERTARQEELLDTVATYAPDLSDDFEEVFAEAEEMHEEMMAIREANKPSEEEREAMKAQMDEVKEQVDAIHQQVKDGEITKEEAKEALEALRPDRDEERGFELGARRAPEGEEGLSKEDREALKTEHEAEQKAYEKALENEDSDAIVAHLEKLLAHMQERNEKMAKQLAEIQ